MVQAIRGVNARDKAGLTEELPYGGVAAGNQSGIFLITFPDGGRCPVARNVAAMSSFEWPNSTRSFPRDFSRQGFALSP